MRISPRERDWMFSSVMSGARPAKAGARAAPNASIAPEMGMVSYGMPSILAQASASSRLWAEV